MAAGRALTHRRQLESALRALRIHSDTTHSWFGRRGAPLHARLRAALDPADRRRYLVGTVQMRLYASFYCQGDAEPRFETDHGALLSGDPELVRRLTAANAGAGPIEPGWTVTALRGATAVVSKDGLTLRAPLPACVAATPIQPGSPIALRLAKDRLAASPGFYIALGDQATAISPSAGMLRLYWNVTPEGAVGLMRALTATLNASKLPFQLKALNQPAAYERTDAAVLYVPADRFRELERVLFDALVTMRDHMGATVPALTKALAPGLGLAEDPIGESSFGMHRCGLVAEALVRAHEHGARDAGSRFDVVRDTFAEAGIDIDRPYLNPGSRADYTLDARPRARRAPRSAGPACANAAAVLDAAAAIAHQLIADAVWHGGRCSWWGDFQTTAGAGSACRSLGPGLYAGTAGVGWFLAECYAATGVDAARRTAVAAIEHALSCAAGMDQAELASLYSGALGIALVAARAARLLDAEPLERRARKLVARVCAGPAPAADELDLLAGHAGAIIGLLAAADALALSAPVERAVQLADQLLQIAGKRYANTRKPVLTGLSHGAAGVGWALLELFRTTGETRFRRAGEAAFDYERTWFDPRRGNWPDLRAVATSRRGAGSLPYCTYWCHGAPGIAQARVRAYEILGTDVYRREALVALVTTRAAAHAAVGRPRADFSLCHGLAGNALVLLRGASLPGTETEGYGETARTIAAAGISRHGGPGASWPCGSGPGSNPTLMLGTAGIGHFLLRVARRCGHPTALEIHGATPQHPHPGRAAPTGTDS